MISSRVTLVPYRHSRSALRTETSLGEGIAGILCHRGVATHWSAFRVDGNPLDGGGRKVSEGQERAARDLLTGAAMTVGNIDGEGTRGIRYVAAAAAATEDNFVVIRRQIAACHCKIDSKRTGFVGQLL